MTKEEIICHKFNSRQVTVKLHVISTIFMNIEHKLINKKKWHQNWRWETSLSLHIIQTHCSRII